MPATIIVNMRTVVHKTSNGMVSFMPDVCLTPTPAGPVPVPYPNMAFSRDTSRGSKTVKMDGNPIMLRDSEFSKSTGDEPGVNGGVVSGVNRGKAKFINYSFDVMVEGKNVPRLGDLMLGNIGAGLPNTPPMPEVQPPSFVTPISARIKDSYDKLKIEIVNRAGEPLKDLRYILKKPDGTKEEGTTDSSGKITVEKTIAGVGRVIFPDMKDITIVAVE